jgi:hypothetical protein
MLKNSHYGSIEEARREIDTSKPCIVLGNGSSLNDLDINKIQKFFTIGVNRIGKLFTPDAHVSVDLPACESKAPLKVSWGNYKDPNYINLGTQKKPSIIISLDLAELLHFKVVYLCGVDMIGNYFWGGNPIIERNNPQYYQHIKGSHFDYFSKYIGRLKILNCSSNSFLTMFPKSNKFIKDAD